MITDADGNALALYHGSYREISEFRPLRCHDSAGIYFTPEFGVAVELAEGACMEDTDEPTVMVAHVEIRHPHFAHGIESHVISIARRDELISLGHDGVIGLMNGEPFEYVAFDPSQVQIIAVQRNPVRSVATAAGPRL